MTEQASVHWSQTTNWTGIVEAGMDPEAMGLMLQRYHSIILQYFTTFYRDPQWAEDVTQQFIARHLDTRAIARKANQQRGRFRQYLRRSLKNYALDHFPPPTAPLPSNSLAAREAGDVFDIAFATSLLNRAIELTAADYRARHRDPQWELFKRWRLDPVQTGSGPHLSLDEMGGQMLGDSSIDPSTVVCNVRKALQRQLRAVIRETVLDEDFDDEVAYIRGLLVRD